MGPHAPKERKKGQTWPISPTVVAPAISVKAHICVNASLDIYSLKITASSMLVLSHSFFVSTHLHGISRLEKRMHTNQPLQISRAEYEVFLFILLITVQSILGKGACREVQLSTSALPEVVLHFYLFLPVLQQFSRGLGRCFERDKIIQCTHTDS